MPLYVSKQPSEQTLAIPSTCFGNPLLISITLYHLSNYNSFVNGTRGQALRPSFTGTACLSLCPPWFLQLVAKPVNGLNVNRFFGIRFDFFSQTANVDIDNSCFS